MSLINQQYIASNSDYMMATCNFNIEQSRDYWFLPLTGLEFDPFTDIWDTQCLTFLGIDIRGYNWDDVSECSWIDPPINTVTWQQSGSHMRINAGRDSGECCYPPWKSTAVVDEDVFGHYEHINNNFTCSINTASTTNWWLGSTAGMTLYTYVHVWVMTR